VKLKEQVIRDLNVLQERVKFISEAKIDPEIYIKIASDLVYEKLHDEIYQRLRHCQIPDLYTIIDHFTDIINKESQPEHIEEPVKQKRRGRPPRKELN